MAGLNLRGCHKKAVPTLMYGSAESSGEIVVVDPGRGSVVARITVGKRPRGLVVSPDGRLLDTGQAYEFFPQATRCPRC